MADQTGILLGDSELRALEDLVRRSGDGGKYGLTAAGFVPKPYAQLLREGLAAARAVLGADVDLAPGSVIRKLIELSALESARTYAAMAGTYDDMFVSTARGPALSRLGDELGLSRPFLRASGTVRLSLAGPAARVRIGRGARLMSRGGHHAFTASGVELTQAAPSAAVEVSAFFPGAAGNLDPAVADQKLALWNDGYGLDGPAEDKLAELRQAAREPDVVPLEAVVSIEQAAPLTGGDARWPDEQYRELLLRMPRSIWTPEAIQTAVSLVPGVRRAVVQDQFGGLDIDRAIFGNFNFIERLFVAERDITSPYAFSILVAPEESAIWSGPGGLREQVLDAVEDLRPIGLFPRVEIATPVHVFVKATITVQGIPLPSRSRAAMNASPTARALKKRLLERVDGYVGKLGFSEPVRAARVAWQLLSDPSVVDVQDLELLQGAAAGLAGDQPRGLGEGENLLPPAKSIPVLVDADDYLTLV